MPPIRPLPPVEEHSTLDQIQRQGRYGVAYLRAVVGQAGCGLKETSPDEDSLSIDGTIEFPAGDVRFQVKTTFQHDISDSAAIHFSAKNRWIKKWKRAQVPIYFVVVVVPDDSTTWLDHPVDGTMMVRTAAYWARIDPAGFETSKTIVVPRTQRLTSATMQQWNSDLLDRFAPGVS